MGLPPSARGAVQETLALALAAVAVPMVGAPGTVNGVTELEASDAALLPTTLVATTVKVYAVPLVSPVTVALVAGAATIAEPPAGDEVTEYEVIGLPPSEAGAVQETVAWALPAVAATAVAAPGTVAGATGVTLLEASDAGLLPIALVATTVKVYAVPLVRPVTVALVAGAVTMAEPPAGEDVTV